MWRLIHEKCIFRTVTGSHYNADVAMLNYEVLNVNKHCLCNRGWSVTYKTVNCPARGPKYF